MTYGGSVIGGSVIGGTPERLLSLKGARVRYGGRRRQNVTQQLSPDGRYIWNGTAWVPNLAAPGAIPGIASPPYANAPPHMVHAGIRYGGFLIRLGAYAIDFVLLEIAAFFVGFTVGLAAVALSGDASGAKPVAVWMGIALGLVYRAAMLAIFGL